MKVQLKPNAADVYVHEQKAGMGRFVNKNTVAKLEKMQGEIFEVDTDWLYPNQFKLMNGEKIDENLVERVIDDVRNEYKRCGDCSHSVPKDSGECEACGHCGHLLQRTDRPQSK